MQPSSPTENAALVIGSVEPITIGDGAPVRDALRVINDAWRHGLPKALAIVVRDGRLAGVVTDGDVRASLLDGGTLDDPVSGVMTTSSVVLEAGTPPTGWLASIRQQIAESGRPRAIRHAVLVDAERRPVGLVDVDRLLEVPAEVMGPIGIIGLGFVGLTLAVALAESGLEVVGYDIDERVRASLAAGVSHVHEPTIDSRLHAQLDDERLRVAPGPDGLTGCSVFLICVNTPIVDGEPDLEPLRAAVEEIAPHLQPGAVVMLRSTVPVGTCRGVVAPAIERHSALRVGVDVGLAFAPERTVAGNALEELHTLPQVVAGVDEHSLAVAERLFARLSPMLIRLERLEEAELVKLVNNTFRDVSFAFANEVALACERHNVRVERVIAAANAGYPRNPVPMASPGVGGPCLPKDSLLFAEALAGLEVPSLAIAARSVNSVVPRRIAERVVGVLRDAGKDPAEAAVLVLGLGFKGEPATNDLRGSPSLEVIDHLRPSVGRILVWDPVVTEDELDGGDEWRDPAKGFGGIDAVICMHGSRSMASLDMYRLLQDLDRPGVFFDGFSLFEPSEVARIPGVHYLDVSFSFPPTR